MGTSMFTRPARKAPHAEAKKGTAENARAGSAIAAETQWNITRVTSPAPDQTATEIAITFIIAKPATAARARRRRPASSLAGRRAVASSSCASKPASFKA